MSGRHRDLRFAMGVDALNACANIPACIANESLSLGGWGDRAGYPAFQGRHNRHRVLDAAPAYLWREAVKLSRIERDLRRLKGRLPALVDDRDVRERVDQLPREVGLRTLHQRRHHNGEPDTGRDARDGHDRLPNPEANVRKRDFKDELHGPPDLATTARTLEPSTSDAGAGDATRSCSWSPDRISTARVPRIPVSTRRSRARSSSMTKTVLVPCTASAGTRRAPGFSRVTTLASTLIPT